MKKIGISLGWNCSSAVYEVENKIRQTKIDGYLTCPFDELVSNLPGILLCIKNDFNNFVNEEYLELVQNTDEIKLLNINFNHDGLVFRHKEYKFIFNHEGPSELHLKEKWPGGINHFIDNNYLKFKERYQQRINNFKNYLNDKNNYIIFIIKYAMDDNNTINFHNVIREKYPDLKYECCFLKNNVNDLLNHLLLMGFDKNDEEVKRLQNIQDLR